MQTISNGYEDIIENSLSFSPKCKIVVDGVAYLGNVIKTSPKFSHSSTNPFGTFPAKTCSFEIYNHSNDIDFQDKEITVYKGIDINGTTEWIAQGVFIPRADDITNNITTKVMSFKDIKDRTQLLEDAYVSQLDWSNNQTHTGLEIVQEICTNKSLTLKSSNFAWASYSFKQPNFSSKTTNREVLARLAQIGGEITIFDNSGELEIKSQYSTGYTIPRKRYEKLSKEKTITYNTVSLGNEGMDNDIIYPETIATDRVEYRILDNPFVDLYKEEMIEDVADCIIGKSYTPFQLDGFVDGFFYELNDVVTIEDKNGDTFSGVFLSYSNTSRIKSIFKAETMNQEQTNYNLAGSNKKTLNDVKLQVNHIENNITALANQVETLEDETGNMYTKEDVDRFFIDAKTGVTNTFSTSGGNNIFRNTGLWFETGDQYNPYEFWNGIVAWTKEENAQNMRALLLQIATVSQEQQVANGKYTVSFKYKKLIELANVKCTINNIEYTLDGTGETEFEQTIDVNSQYINVQFSSDITDSCEIYDLMVNSGEVKLAYTQNQNETTTDTVNISKGITITASDMDVTFKANADGIRTLDKNGTRKTQFTDTGMITTDAEIENKATIVSLLHKRVGNHVWVSKI